MKAFILSAGLGTRLHPLTLTMPKALVPINGVPLLEYNIRRLMAQGITEFVVNVHHFAEQIEDFLHKHNNFGCNIAISDERNVLLDTGGGLLHAAHLLVGDEPFLIQNVDVITSFSVQQLLAEQAKSGDLARLAVSARKSSRYFLFDDQMRLCGWRNTQTGEEKLSTLCQKELTPLAFGGIHIVSPKIFDLLLPFGSKFSIVDAYLSLAAQHQIAACNMGDVVWYDVGSPAKLQAAALACKPI
ncbi:MAG: nucleotidyltransferase family protein [Bacteroidales bacterium]